GEGAEGIYLFNLFTHGDASEVMKTILAEGLALETVSAKEKSIPENAVRECEALLKSSVQVRLAPAMDVLPLGSVQPEGWLKTQLQLQAEGLTGHAEELYDDIGKSDWLTEANVGKEFAWERGPYYAKGLVSLAFVLNDAALKAKAKRWVDAILASQRANGDFGPKTRNWWANMIALWLLRDWCEATGDPRVEPFLARYFAFQRTEFATYPLAAESKWAVARAGDELDVVLWLYRRTGRSEWLDFAKTVSAQSADWATYYYRGGDPAGPNANGCRSHIVNFMQGLKTPALQFLLDGDTRKRNAYTAAFDAKGWVMKMCGRPDRMINGSEPMVDRSASQGTELCAIAERILSCQTVLAATGLLPAADDLEMVAYNSLPATLGADGRGLRYYCLLNQPSCEDKFLCFANNGGSRDSAQMNGAICPGPHAGFGCCRSNFHLAWPKFVQSMWMRRGEGLAVVAYGPSRLETTVAGRRVVIVQETGYPFDGKIMLRIVEGGGKFPLHARVPAWSPVTDAGRFRTFDREWKVGDRIELEFPMPVTTSLWAGDAVAVQRGPLLFALRPESEERIVPRYRVPFEKRWIENGGGAFPRKEILPKSPWNYALVLNADHRLPQAEVVGKGTNLQIRVKAVKTDFGGWGYMRDVTTGRAVDPPASPLQDEGGSVETIGLVPMGCAQVRITLFPWLEKEGVRE
ncbi:MAG: glycoside hydrolase family 127 protein, partial [bacterium]|nr:glycoside hydrolase family 127 protein [bacterium]